MGCARFLVRFFARCSELQPWATIFLLRLPLVARHAAGRFSWVSSLFVSKHELNRAGYYRRACSDAHPLILSLPARSTASPGSD